MLYPTQEGELHRRKVLRELTPGIYESVTEYDWRGDEVVFVSHDELGITYEEKVALSTGDRFQIGGVAVRVLNGNIPYSDAISVVRDEGFRSRLICARWWIALRILNPLSRLLWRTAWAWHLMDCKPEEESHWGQFRPYRCLRRLTRKEERK